MASGKGRVKEVGGRVASGKGRVKEVGGRGKW